MQTNLASVLFASNRILLKHLPCLLHGMNVLPVSTLCSFTAVPSRRSGVGGFPRTSLNNRQRCLETSSLGSRSSATNYSASQSLRAVTTCLSANMPSSDSTHQGMHMPVAMSPLKSPYHPCGFPAAHAVPPASPYKRKAVEQPYMMTQQNSASTAHAFTAFQPDLHPTGGIQQVQPSEHASGALGSPANVPHNLNKALKSVCKVFATIASYHNALSEYGVLSRPRSPNYATPWQMLQQSKSTASGFAIAPLSKRRILTNAHAVANQCQVQLRKHGNARKFTARVLAVGHECDIAMLTVDDDEFWEGVEALDIGGLPSMQESVCVVGYPTGGDNVCVTKGVVSRIDRQQYSHGRTSLLTLQIDAAINSGNSGGPVIKGNKLIGIAFQCLSQGDNIGYVIPVPVINHFLEDLDRHGGSYTGFCDLGINWQILESNDHKASIGMPQSLTGVYVTAVEPCYQAAQVLRPGDVVTHFNGQAIADDGTFLFTKEHHSIPPTNPENMGSNSRHAAGTSFQVPSLLNNAPVSSPYHNRVAELQPAAQTMSAGNAASGGNALVVSDQVSSLATLPMIYRAAGGGPLILPGSAGGHQQSVRIDFRHLVSMNYHGDVCTLDLWRDGEALPGVKVQLSTPKQLVPVHSHDQKPHYFIFGGLVLTRLTNFYLRSTYGVDWTHKAPIKLCNRSFAGVMDKEGQECVILSKVLAWDCNHGYQDLGNVELLRVAGVPVHNLAHAAYILHNHPGPYVRLDLEWNKVIVLDVSKCRTAMASILRQNCIPGDGYFPLGLVQAPSTLTPELRDATDKALGRTVPCASATTAAGVAAMPRAPSLDDIDVATGEAFIITKTTAGGKAASAAGQGSCAGPGEPGNVESQQGVVEDQEMGSGC